MYNRIAKGYRSRRNRRISAPIYPDVEVREAKDGSLVLHNDPTGRSLAVMAEFARRSGRFADAMGLFQKAAVGLEARTHRDVYCWSLWGQATTLRNQGEYEMSGKLYNIALAASLSSRVTLCERWCIAGLAEIDRMRGFLLEARRSHEELRTLFEKDNDARGLGWALSGLAQIHLNMGMLAAAYDEFRRATDVSEQCGDHTIMAYSLRGQAEVLLRRGGAGHAHELAQAALDEFRKLNYQIGEAYTLRTLSHISYASGQKISAISQAESALDIFRRLRKPRGVAYVFQTLQRYDLKSQGQVLGAASEDGRALASKHGIWLSPLPRVLF